MRDFRDYINDILSSVEEIESFVKGLTFDKFVRDKKTINAVIRSLEVIGEASKKIPNVIRKKYPEIPWRKMAGMRDKLIHEYFGIDYEIIWEVVTNEIQELKTCLKNLKKELQ